uniref:GOLD domain-containing protein n=1 Tax=Electrophorus electricus TaxID=8005 RepID=A0A4W4H5N3_ELEEL
MYETCSTGSVPGQLVNLDMKYCMEAKNYEEVSIVQVLHFCTFPAFCLIGVATWQVFYLHYFIKARSLLK